jgi:hypothetical protein
MELHELHVGEGGTGAEGHRHAVARSDVGIARVEVDLARAAGREQRDGRLEDMDLAGVRVEDVGAQRAIALGATRLVGGDDVDRAMVLEEMDPGMRARAGQQRALDLAPRGSSGASNSTPFLRRESMAAGPRSTAWRTTSG